MKTWADFGIELRELPPSYLAAKQAGAIHYFTGKPCKYGHITFRYAANGKCATCAKKDCALYHQRHLQDERTRKKQWAKLNPAKNLAQTHRWKRLNADKHARMEQASKQRLFLKDPEAFRLQHRVAAAIRRARRLAAGGTYTAQDILKIYAWQQGACYWCQALVGKTYHVDHVVPLARGGSNRPENLCIACQPCNLRKFTKMPYEFIGRLF
jgi:5-methylcytosine-specific restriction endonuclease McrA